MPGRGIKFSGARAGRVRALSHIVRGLPSAFPANDFVVCRARLDPCERIPEVVDSHRQEQGANRRRGELSLSTRSENGGSLRQIRSMKNSGCGSDATWGTPEQKITALEATPEVFVSAHQPIHPTSDAGGANQRRAAR